MASYYAPRTYRFTDLKRAYAEYEMYDEREAYFADKRVMANARGKGTPKKKKTIAGMWLLLLVYSSLLFPFFGVEAFGLRLKLCLGGVAVVSRCFSFHKKTHN